VLSPFAKKAYISKAFHSHVSIVKFCEITFGLQSINTRNAASDNMPDCFDFQQVPLPAPTLKTHPKPKPKPKPKTKKPKTKPKTKPKSKPRKPAQTKSTKKQKSTHK